MKKEEDPQKIKEKILGNEKSREKIKIEIIKASAKALDYKKLHPELSNEAILEDVVKEVEEKGPFRVAAMAAAAKALEYKENKPKVADKDIMQKIMDESNSILDTIDVDIE